VEQGLLAMGALTRWLKKLKELHCYKVMRARIADRI
jgi:hypothetical protein